MLSFPKCCSSDDFSVFVCFDDNRCLFYFFSLHSFFQSIRTHSEGLTKKRQDYLEWPEYFMAVAFLSAQRSKDPSSQVPRD